MATARCLSDFRCSVVVGARHVAPESDSLLRFGALQLAMAVIHREKNRQSAAFLETWMRVVRGDLLVGLTQENTRMQNNSSGKR